MCLYPKLIINRKYIPNKKNNWTAPQIKDNRTLYVPVGCGKCMECRKQKTTQWAVRMQEEVRTHKRGHMHMVTLTFSNESIVELKKEIGEIEGYELDNEIATLGVRRFLERWRKKYGVSVKHWLITELGHNGTENIHMHGIIFTDKREEIKKIWKYGYVYIGDYVSEKTVNYCVKYIKKVDLKHREYNPKVLTSPAMGSGYLKRYDAQLNKHKINGETKETYTTRNGTKLNLPIYYRNKIYTDQEKEALWLQKLDKQERWINGIKIDISKGYERYDQILKAEREKNARLGYGNDQKNWDRIKYEHDRRIINQNKRTRDLENKDEETIFGFKKYKLNKCST